VDGGINVDCYTTGLLDKLRGNPHVWVLFSHVWVGDGLQEDTMFFEPSRLSRIVIRIAAQERGHVFMT